MQIESPPARTKANPTLATLHQVEAILRDAHDHREGPLSYAELERRMPARRVRFEVLQASVLELARHKLVTVGSDGIMWVVPSTRRKVRHAPLE